MRVIFLGFLCGTPASLREEGALRVWGRFHGGLWGGVPTLGSRWEWMQSRASERGKDEVRGSCLCLNNLQ